MTGAGAVRDIQVVVIGAGNGASAHLRALKEMGAQVTAVVTGHPDQRQAALALFPGARVDWPASEALSRGADLAVIASPTATHLDLVQEAAERGIDVVVEKPLEARLDRAEELVRVAQTSGIGFGGWLPPPGKAAARGPASPGNLGRAGPADRRLGLGTVVASHLVLRRAGPGLVRPRRWRGTDDPGDPHAGPAAVRTRPTGAGTRRAEPGGTADAGRGHP